MPTVVNTGSAYAKALEECMMKNTMTILKNPKAETPRCSETVKDPGKHWESAGRWWWGAEWSCIYVQTQDQILTTTTLQLLPISNLIGFTQPSNENSVNWDIYLYSAIENMIDVIQS